MTERPTPPLRPELLADVRPAFWHRIDVVDETGSTNADLAARAAAGEDIARTVLAAELRIGVGEAGRRIADATVLAPRVGITGEQLAPVLVAWRQP